LSFEQYKTLLAEHERYKGTLEVIRDAGHNEFPGAQWMQQYAAWALTNGRVPQPKPLE
jgi:hypothetical protein